MCSGSSGPVCAIMDRMTTTGDWQILDSLRACRFLSICNSLDEPIRGALLRLGANPDVSANSLWEHIRNSGLGIDKRVIANHKLGRCGCPGQEKPKRRCTVRKFLDGLPDDIRLQLEALMANSNVSHRSLSEALTASGSKLARDSITNHRKSTCICEE